MNGNKTKRISEMAPRLLREWHLDKNNGLSLDNFTTGSHKKAWWKCDEGHVWQAEIKSRVSGTGCPYCSGRLVLAGYNDLQTLFPNIAKEWNYEKNASENAPSNIMPGSHKKIWWKCSKGHEWQATPNKRTSLGRGCPYCSHNPKVIIGETDFETNAKHLIAEWDYEKNEIKPSDVTMHSNVRVWWKCSKGHEWRTSINHRINGSGCPICSSGAQTSFPEQAIFFYVRKFYPDAINKDTTILDNSRMELDIYIPSLKIGIEYDGEAFHRGVRMQKREVTKYEICKGKEITLIRIRESTELLEDNADYVISVGSSLDSAIVALTKHLPLLQNIDIERDRDAIRNEYMVSLYNRSLQAINPSVANEWNYERNSTTPDMYLPNSNAKVWWKCDEGHEWQATIDTRNIGRKCPYCTNRKVLKGFNDLKTKRPDLMREWHPILNEINAENVLPGSGKKAWWKCSEGHEWQAEISSRNKGAGCPVCAKRKTR